jgi:hypothetical protein
MNRFTEHIKIGEEEKKKLKYIKYEYEIFRQKYHKLIYAIGMYLVEGDVENFQHIFIEFVEAPYKILSRYKTFLLEISKDDPSLKGVKNNPHDSIEYIGSSLLTKEIVEFSRLFDVNKFVNSEQNKFKENNYKIYCMDLSTKIFANDIALDGFDREINNDATTDYLTLQNIRNNETHAISIYDFTISDDILSVSYTNKKSWSEVREERKEIKDLKFFTENIYKFITRIDTKFFKLVNRIYTIQKKEDGKHLNIDCAFIGSDNNLYNGYVSAIIIYNPVNGSNDENSSTNYEASISTVVNKSILDHTVNEQYIIFKYDNIQNLFHSIINLKGDNQDIKNRIIANNQLQKFDKSQKRYTKSTIKKTDFNSDKYEYVLKYINDNGIPDFMTDDSDIVKKMMEEKHAQYIFDSMIRENKGKKLTIENKSSTGIKTENKELKNIIAFVRRYSQFLSTHVMDILLIVNTENNKTIEVIKKIFNEIESLFGYDLFGIFNIKIYDIVKEYVNKISKYNKEYAINQMANTGAIERLYKYVILFSDGEILRDVFRLKPLIDSGPQELCVKTINDNMDLTINQINHTVEEKDYRSISLFLINNKIIIDGEKIINIKFWEAYEIEMNNN